MGTEIVKTATMGRARPQRCAVCGCGDVVLDEVLEHGGWLLAECPRCDHRWTRPLPIRSHSVRRSELPSEVADAA